MKKINYNCRLVVNTIAFLFLLSNQNAFGQFVPKILQANNVEIRSKTENVDPAGWLYLNQTANILPGELFVTLKQATGLKENDEMQVTKQWTDKYGWSHVRYQQFHKGLKVEGGEWSEHWKDCFTEIAHGKLVEDLEINENPRISAVQAIEIAKQQIGAIEYAWQNAVWENALKEELGDMNATYYPQAELLIGHVLGAEYVKENYRLSWKFKILATSPSSFNEVYVDAHSGQILSLKPVVEYNGPATLLFGYGEHTIDTKPILWYHILKANNLGKNIHTKYGSGVFGGLFWLTSNITDNDDDWGVAEQMGTTSHWVVSESWEYFHDVHGRNGYDGNGEEVRIWANSILQNAGRFRQSGKEYIEFGSIGGIYLATIDIAGHEFTHGMSANLADFGRLNEPGALSESFSDIFGVHIERNAEGALNDWTIGEDAPVVVNGGTNVRSLANPGAFPAPALADRGNLGLPDTYEGPRWYFGANDLGGVHINCGVQNRWFHLLSNGGTHNGINVQPIGIDNSAEITYFNLSTFMMNGSQYADARQGAINAARIIFGACSFEEIQTTNAWSACGVGPLFTGPCLELHGPDLICVDQFHGATYTAIDVPGSIFTWNYPPQWTAYTTGQGNRHLVVTSLGYLPPAYPYTLSVSVTSSNGGIETMQVILDDCLFNDDPCEEVMYFVGNNKMNNPIRHLNNPEIKELSHIQEQESNYVMNIYPNPTNGTLNISISPMITSHKEIYIINFLGQVVKKIETQSIIVKIDVTDLQNGIYTLKIEDQGKLTSKTFIKME